MNTGELRGAEELFRRAVTLAPDSYEAYNGLGIALGGAPTIVEGSRWWRLLTHGLSDFGVLVERLILSDLR